MTEPAIVGGDLQTPLESATFVRAGWTASRAAAMLAQGQFDQAPVLSGARLVGYALRIDLEANPTRPVRRVTRPLDQEILLSASAPLAALLTTLRNRRFAFIVGDGGISGFVTPSDLNKHAARAHFYLLIAALEIKMSDLIRQFGQPGEELLASLSLASRRLVKRRFREDAADEIEVDYLVYMLFSQLLNVVGRETALLTRLGFTSRSAWRRSSRGLARLRNDVMHPTRAFFGPKRSVGDLIEAEARLHLLLDRLNAAPTTPREATHDSFALAPIHLGDKEPPRRTLHDAMRQVLAEAGHPMRPRDLAAAINARGLYHRGDGAPVPSGQISARANNYEHLFVRTSAGLGLRGDTYP